jgi:dTDP-4-amino-4,6-dideoxygalactose transaminase
MKTERIAVPLLDLKAQYGPLREAVRAALDEVIEAQHFILGPQVEALEKEVAAYSNCAHGVGVSSGTDAILAALMALNLGAGDEVITTPYTFFATAGCVARVGAKTIFVDIEPDSFNIDPAQIEAAVTPRTKAIMPVHLFGQMAEMDAIMGIAARYNLHVIEDAAQAIGSEYKGRRAGSIGHLGCFSFFPSKNLGCFGDGGLVTSNDAELSDRVKLMRGHGARPKYYHKEVGGNFRLDALQAAVLRVKLPHLDSWSAGRQQNAADYRRLFAESGLVASGKIALPVELPERRHIYNQFALRCERRDELLNYMKAHNIGTEVYYPVPLHLQDCFAALGYKQGDFPHSERAALETLAVPIYPELTAAQKESVVGVISDFYAA